MRLHLRRNAPSARPFTHSRRLTIGVVVGALLVPAVAWAAWAFTDVPSTSPAFRSITAVADAGLMTGSNGKFRPDQNVTRQGLAQVLHRGLHRASIDATVEDITTGQPDPPTIATTNMTIDGYQRGAQGVLLQLGMQVEAAQPFAQDCSVVLEATSWPENFDAGSWTFKMYKGERDATVDATFLTGQLAGTAYTYDITADSSCSQPLHVVQSSWTAQSAAFQGNGTAFDD